MEVRRREETCNRVREKETEKKDEGGRNTKILIWTIRFNLINGLDCDPSTIILTNRR